MSATRKSTGTTGRVVLVVLAVVLVLAVLRLAALFVFASEGDVPPASAVHLPAGSEVVDEDVDCGSGGCWTALSVRPPAGTTPEQLATTLGTTPSARVPGTLWDPRTVRLGAEVDGDLLTVRADYWS